MRLVKGTCYRLWGECVLYLGYSPADGLIYPCDQCGKERTRLHWFIDACRPHNPRVSYKYGSECVRHLDLKPMSCPSASSDYPLPEEYD
jgi:hypothetical protein